MTWDSAFVWLVQSVFVTTLVLAVTALALNLFHQPADRSRLIQWALAAAAICLPLAAMPRLSLLSLSVLERAPVVSAAAAPTSEPTRLAPQDAVLDENAGTAPAAVHAPSDLVEQARDTSHEEHPNKIATALPPLLEDSNFAAILLKTLCVGYVAGSVLLLCRFLAAHRKLRQLVRTARPAPSSILELLHEIAGHAADRVCVLTSNSIHGPVTFGVRTPVILIPANALSDSEMNLRYALAHEWAHVSRRDALVWQLSSVLQGVFYYQPLYWYLRRQLSVCLDQLADADAASQGENHADYASFLVQLARQQHDSLPRLSLGISTHGTSLRRRVVMLLAAARPRPTCSRLMNRAIGVAAIGAALFVSTLRLDAEPAAPPAAPTAAAAQPVPAEATEGLPKPIVYEGTVVDAHSGKPISDATVQVWRRDSTDWSDLEVTEHRTDAEGHYSFTLSPEQVARSHLYLEVAARHPNYAMKGRSGYSHDMIRKNLTLGEPPFYSKIRLWPGEAITGTIVDPAGQPVEGVEISLFTRADDMPQFRFAREKTKTDERGNFRVVPPTPGNGVLWIKPDHFTPLAFLVGDRRGDWGEIKVAKGTDVPGKVVDQDGSPVAGVRVEARREGDGPEVDKWLRENSVANSIGRRTVTAADGSYTLAALPDGEYTITLASDSDSYDPPPLAQVFMPRDFKVTDGVAPDPIEIRAVPSVTIKARYFDSAGKPRSGHDQTLFGKAKGEFYFTASNNPGDDGWFEIRAPRGLTDAEIDLSTNEHSALRWRLGADAPLMRSRRVKLGTLEKDIDNLQVIRYVAPVLLVKPVDEHGVVLTDCKLKLTYGNQDPKDELINYVSGGNVSLEHQPDGRWRSEQLLPDEPFKIEVEKVGYESAAKELSLAEGVEREITVVLKPAASAPPAEEPATKQ